MQTCHVAGTPLEVLESESLDRLPDGRAPHLELLSDRVFINRMSWRDPQRNDAVAKCVVRTIAQHPARPIGPRHRYAPIARHWYVRRDPRRRRRMTTIGVLCPRDSATSMEGLAHPERAKPSPVDLTGGACQWPSVSAGIDARRRTILRPSHLGVEADRLIPAAVQRRGRRRAPSRSLPVRGLGSGDGRVRRHRRSPRGDDLGVGRCDVEFAVARLVDRSFQAPRAAPHSVRKSRGDRPLRALRDRRTHR